MSKERNIPVRIVLLQEGSEFRRMYPPHVQARLKTFFDGLTAAAPDSVTFRQLHLVQGLAQLP